MVSGCSRWDIHWQQNKEETRLARRLASLAVLTLVIVVALQSAAMGQTTIDFAHGTTGGAFKTFLDTLIEEFEAENPGVVFRQNAMKDEIYETTGLLALFQAQTPPDLFFQWGG